MEKQIDTNQEQLYQWVKGDDAGEFCYAIGTEVEDDMEFILFDNDTRVNKAVFDEFIIPVKSEEDGYIIKEERINDIVTTKGKDGIEYDIPGPNHGKIKRVKVPMKKKKKAPKKPKEENVNSKPDKVIEKATNIPTQSIDSPILALLEKAKKSKQTYEIKLNIDAIPESLYDVIKENFDDGEENTLEYLISLIDLETLKSDLKEKIREIYNARD